MVKAGKMIAKRNRERTGSTSTAVASKRPVPGREFDLRSTLGRPRAPRASETNAGLPIRMVEASLGPWRRRCWQHSHRTTSGFERHIRAFVSRHGANPPATAPSKKHQANRQHCSSRPAPLGSVVDISCPRRGAGFRSPTERYFQRSICRKLADCATRTHRHDRKRSEQPVQQQ